MLNALDGVASSDGRIVFMTTNYIERLDPALIRPGRVDIKQFVGHATDYQARRMFLRFFPESNEKLASEFVQRLMIINKNVSSAQIQGFFMLYKNHPQGAILNVEEFFKNS